MIPVLYPSNTLNFTTFGIGVLTDTISCEVTEARNGVYECLLKYPVTGQHYSEIAKECIIKAKPNDIANPQAFRIYRITKPLNGVVSIYSQHISYDLANIPVLPFSSESRSPSLILEQLLAGDPRFTGWTDYSEAKAFSVAQPKSVRACLGGTEGSMLSKWHGEFEWDNFLVKFHSHRGTKTGVVIEYGKNLTALEQDEDNSGVYTALLPYAVYTVDGVETVVTLPEQTLAITTSEILRSKVLIMDFSSRFDGGTAVTADTLRAVAVDYLAENPLGTTVPTVKVSFEPLWKQPEYSALLERVRLCDTVTIRHTALGVTVSAMVIETVYNTLAERYRSITLGSEKSSMITTVSDIQSSVSAVETTVGHFPALLQTAIGNATNLITGQAGGYVVTRTNENGQPYELLILDAPTLDNAVNVWRWNVGGLGFSSNGYNGPYNTAITSDGQIVADFITSGSLIANIIKAGVIQSQDGSSWWDLETGEVVLKSYATTSSVLAVSERIEEIGTKVDGIHDITISDVAPEQPYEGQLWVNTGAEPPETMIWDGAAWKVQNDLETLRETVTRQTTKSAELDQSLDGLNSYVSVMTETIDTVNSTLAGQQQTVVNMESEVSELRHTVEGMSINMEQQFAGGINFVKNSSGLNGVSDDWTKSGTVTTEASTDVLNNTTADSCFVLGAYSSLQQVITGVVTGSSYVFSLRAKKVDSVYSAYFRITYNGNKVVYLFNTSETFGWTEYSAVINDVQDSTITIYMYSRAATLYVADIMMAEWNCQ